MNQPQNRPLPPHHLHHHKSDAAVIGHAGNHGDAIRAIAAVMRQSDHGYGALDRRMPDDFAPLQQLAMAVLQMKYSQSGKPVDSVQAY